MYINYILYFGITNSKNIIAPRLRPPPPQSLSLQGQYEYELLTKEHLSSLEFSEFRKLERLAIVWDVDVDWTGAHTKKRWSKTFDSGHIMRNLKVLKTQQSLTRLRYLPISL